MTTQQSVYPRITFRLDQELKEKIEGLAAERETSNSRIIKEAIEAYLKKNK
jgi:predicted transcriptional regulator